MFALIRFPDTFCLFVPKHFFYSAYIPPDLSPPEVVPRLLARTKPLMKSYKPSALKWDFTVY